MPLNFNMDEVSKSRRVQPGDYSFRITDCKEETYKSKNKGLTMSLEVLAGERIINMKDYFPYKGRITYLDALCVAVGLVLDPDKLNPEDFINKQGRARYDYEEDSLYLEAKEYYPAGKSPSTGSAKPKLSHAPNEEDVPF